MGVQSNQSRVTYRSDIMAMLSKLLVYTEEEKRAVLKHHNITEKDLEDYIEQLKTWAVKADLPEEDDVSVTNKMRIALLNSKMSLEKAKQCVQGYHTIRTIYSDFFDRLVPNTVDYNAVKNLVKTVVLPKLSPDLCRITLFQMNDPDGIASDGLAYEVVAVMEAELRIKTEDYFVSNIIIIDMRNYSAKILIKYSPMVCQKLVNIMLAVNLRLKNIHFVYESGIVDRLMMLVKAILPGKILKKVCFHKTIESIHDYIPKEYLPTDFGGDQPSMEKLYDDWCKLLESRETQFKQLLNVKCTKTLDRSRYNDDFGAQGSFKKLAID